MAKLLLGCLIGREPGKHQDLSGFHGKNHQRTTRTTPKTTDSVMWDDWELVRDTTTATTDSDALVYSGPRHLVPHGWWNLLKSSSKPSRIWWSYFPWDDVSSRIGWVRCSHLENSMLNFACKLAELEVSRNFQHCFMFAHYFLTSKDSSAGMQELGSRNRVKRVCDQQFRSGGRNSQFSHSFLDKRNRPLQLSRRPRKGSNFEDIDPWKRKVLADGWSLGSGEANCIPERIRIERDKAVAVWFG